MLRECPFCGYQQDTSQELFGCGSCGAELDFSPYVSPYISEETLKKEGNVIPETKGTSKEFNPWLTKDQIPEKGMVITITGEWSAPSSPKISSFLIGDCEYNGNTYTHGINQTSYYEIAKVYGKDTKEWVGKKIEYQGKVKMGQRGAMGHLWTAVK